MLILTWQASTKWFHTTVFIKWVIIMCFSTLLMFRVFLCRGRIDRLSFSIEFLSFKIEITLMVSLNHKTSKENQSIVALCNQTFFLFYIMLWLCYVFSWLNKLKKKQKKWTRPFVSWYREYKHWNEMVLTQTDQGMGKAGK